MVGATSGVVYKLVHLDSPLVASGHLRHLHHSRVYFNCVQKKNTPVTPLVH